VPPLDSSTLAGGEPADYSGGVKNPQLDVRYRPKADIAKPQWTSAVSGLLLDG